MTTWTTSPMTTKSQITVLVRLNDDPNYIAAISAERGLQAAARAYSVAPGVPHPPTRAMVSVPQFALSDVMAREGPGVAERRSGACDAPSFDRSFRLSSFVTRRAPRAANNSKPWKASGNHSPRLVVTCPSTSATVRRPVSALSPHLPTALLIAHQRFTFRDSSLQSQAS